MINVFVAYTPMTEDILEEQRLNGVDRPTVILADDGWTPESILSPVREIVGYQGGDGLSVYKLPYKEIVHRGSFAEIVDIGKVIGRVRYASSGASRVVKKIEWLDNKGNVVMVHNYCSEGFVFRVDYLSNGAISSVSWLNKSGHQVMLHDASSKLCQVFNEDRSFRFISLHDFYLDFVLQHSNGEGFFIDSLGMPFVLTTLAYGLKHELYWVEKAETVPDNMRMFLSQNDLNTVSVMSRDQYDLIKSLNPDRVSHKPFGFMGRVKSLDKVRCFTLTSVDELVGLEDLLVALPDVEFGVGALTEFSDRLVDLASRYKNLTLYAGLSPEGVDKHLECVNVYLDINKGLEVMGIVRIAVKNGLIVLSLSDTVHSPVYVPSEQVFESVSDLKTALSQLGK